MGLGRVSTCFIDLPVTHLSSYSATVFLFLNPVSIQNRNLDPSGLNTCMSFVYRHYGHRARRAAAWSHARRSRGTVSTERSRAHACPRLSEPSPGAQAPKRDARLSTRRRRPRMARAVTRREGAVADVRAERGGAAAETMLETHGLVNKSGRLSSSTDLVVGLPVIVRGGPVDPAVAQRARSHSMVGSLVCFKRVASEHLGHGTLLEELKWQGFCHLRAN